MAYDKRNIPNGHKLTAEDLAHLETGIAGAYDYVDDVAEGIQAGTVSDAEIDAGVDRAVTEGRIPEPDLTGYATEVYVTDAISAVPAGVTSVNGETGAVTLDLGGGGATLPLSLAVALSARNIAPVDIVMVGSSSTEGGADQSVLSYVTHMSRAFATTYNPVGVPGGTAYRTAGIADTGWTFTGTTTEAEGGMGGHIRTLSTGATMTRTETMTGVTVVFEAGAPDFDVTLDGAAPIRVSPAATQQVWSSPSLVEEEHTVTITAATGAISVEYVYAHRNDRDYGVRVWNAGKGSTRQYSWTVTRAEKQQAALSQLRPAGITLQQGSNEINDGVTSAGWASQVEQWMDGIITALGYTPWFGLFAQHPRPIYTTEQSGLWEEYKAEMRRIASERPYVTYHDGGPGFATDGTDPLDLVQSDGMHLTQRGYTLLSGNLLDSLGVPVRSTATVPPAVTEALPEPFVDLHNTVALFDATKVEGEDGSSITSWSPFAGSETTPAVATSSTPPIIRRGYVNGEDSLEFTGSGSILETATWGASITGPITMLSVHWLSDIEATAGNMQIAGSTSPNLVYQQHYASTSVYTTGRGGAGQLNTAAVARGQWVVSTIVFDGAGSRLYVNSTTPVTGTTGADTPMDKLRIGQNSNGSAPLYGHLPYLRVCAKSLTQDEVAAEMQDLATRYGITLA